MPLSSPGTTKLHNGAGTGTAVGAGVAAGAVVHADKITGSTTNNSKAKLLMILIFNSISLSDSSVLPQSIRTGHKIYLYPRWMPQEPLRGKAQEPPEGDRKRSVNFSISQSLSRCEAPLIVHANVQSTPYLTPCIFNTKRSAYLRFFLQYTPLAGTR
ncbi:MAG: hypothetical protein WA061_05725 [Microgenomates group bacterium]